MYLCCVVRDSVASLHGRRERESAEEGGYEFFLKGDVC